MKYYQWIFLLIAIILILYVYNQIETSRRLSLYGNDSKKEGIIGNINYELSEVNSIKNNNQVQIKNMSKDFINQPLKEYIIKGAYNCSVSGNYVSKDMIRYVLERGCRFLDFEVVYINNKPMVSYTLDRNYEMIETNNTLLLDDALLSCVGVGFSQKSPNPKDPIFIHLRVKSKDKSIFNAIGKSVDYALRHFLYKNKITDETKLKDVMGKVVLLLDARLDRNYHEYTECEPSDHTCYDLSKFVNVDSGTNIISINKYSEVLNEQSIELSHSSNCNYCTNVEKYRMAIPNVIDNASNPEPKSMFIDHGIQIVPLQFHKRDEYLEQYEAFFDEYRSSFVPLSNAISYYVRNAA